MNEKREKGRTDLRRKKSLVVLGMDESVTQEEEKTVTD